MSGMNVTIIDGQGGQLGAGLVKEITAQCDGVNLTVVGTNAIATAALLKAGAKNAATGENAVTVACRKADVIIGPLGIVIADALLGEITDKMAAAVGRAEAVRILIPTGKCDNIVVGVHNPTVKALIDEAVDKLKDILSK